MPIPYRLIVVIIFAIILLIDLFLSRSKKTWRLLSETVHTIKEEWMRVSVLLFIAFFFGAAYLDSERKQEHYFHIFLEFIGTLVLFLVVEHTIKKLGSGISDPDELPITDFITQLENGKNELIILDTVIESIMSEDAYRLKFANSLRSAVSKSASFTARILILDLNSQYAKERALQLGMDYDAFLDTAYRCKTQLLHTIAEIELDKKCQSKIFVHEYNISPPFAMYAVDYRGYISFFPKGNKSSNSRQLYLTNESELGQQIFNFFYSKFEEIWNQNSKEISKH
jgi:hypothetical protein